MGANNHRAVNGIQSPSPTNQTTRASRSRVTFQDEGERNQYQVRTLDTRTDEDIIAEFRTRQQNGSNLPSTQVQVIASVKRKDSPTTTKEGATSPVGIVDQLADLFKKEQIGKK